MSTGFLGRIYRLGRALVSYGLGPDPGGAPPVTADLLTGIQGTSAADVMPALASDVDRLPAYVSTVDALEILTSRIDALEVLTSVEKRD